MTRKRKLLLAIILAISIISASTLLYCFVIPRVEVKVETHLFTPILGPLLIINLRVKNEGTIEVENLTCRLEVKDLTIDKSLYTGWFNLTKLLPWYLEGEKVGYFNLTDFEASQEDTFELTLEVTLNTSQVKNLTSKFKYIYNGTKEPARVFWVDKVFSWGF
jgi:hypothetical protein